ncbi:hypothetical protein F4779DRAFT_589580 [Xylariaceae sp. FL0662B]|nr:hypothetical protein F4779DRAFT_589580 [Xylariaceae sp. FL0662B]
MRYLRRTRIGTNLLDWLFPAELELTCHLLHMVSHRYMGRMRCIWRTSHPLFHGPDSLLEPVLLISSTDDGDSNCLIWATTTNTCLSSYEELDWELTPSHLSTDIFHLARAKQHPGLRGGAVVVPCPPLLARVRVFRRVDWTLVGRRLATEEAPVDGDGREGWAAARHPLSLSARAHTHTHTHTYIYIQVPARRFEDHREQGVQP